MVTFLFLTVSRQQSHYQEAVYFLALSSQIFLVLIWSTLEGWKAESILEPPKGFEHDNPGLESSTHTYDWAINIY